MRCAMARRQVRIDRELAVVARSMNLHLGANSKIAQHRNTVAGANVHRKLTTNPRHRRCTTIPGLTGDRGVSTMPTRLG